MTRRYLLDSGAAEDWLRVEPNTDARARRVRAAGGVLGICTPVLGELLGGYEKSQTRAENLKRLARGLAELALWPFEEHAAREYGRLWALLRQIGRPMQTIDIQIAAVAFALGNTAVVTKDSDLSAVPGLAVEDWSQPEPTP